MTVRPDSRLADAPMVPVSCRRCGARVLARKSSWEQTSVQWDAAGTARCVPTMNVARSAIAPFANGPKIARSGRSVPSA